MLLIKHLMLSYHVQRRSEILEEFLIRTTAYGIERHPK